MDAKPVKQIGGIELIENPKVGMQGWIITDLWETMCAVPVTISAEDAERGVFVCRWQITEWKAERDTKGGGHAEE